MSEEEVHHCIRRGDYYVIAPMLPELRHGRSETALPLNREYSSADAPVGLDQTRQLLHANQLTVDQTSPSAVELLR